jgi:hypothetical protein
VGGLRFSGLRVKVWWDGAQVVAAASSLIKSPRLQPYLSGDVKKLGRVVWSSRTFSGCGDLRIVKELHRRFILLLCLLDGCGLLGPFGDFPSATNNVMPALDGAVAAARHRHGLEVEDEGNLKNFDVIFLVVDTFCPIAKKIKKINGLQIEGGLLSK